MLEVPGSNIFKATTGCRKPGHRPPVVALSLWWQWILFLFHDFALDYWANPIILLSRKLFNSLFWEYLEHWLLDLDTIMNIDIYILFTCDATTLFLAYNHVIEFPNWTINQFLGTIGIQYTMAWMDDIGLHGLSQSVYRNSGVLWLNDSSCWQIDVSSCESGRR